MHRPPRAALFGVPALALALAACGGGSGSAQTGSSGLRPALTGSAEQLTGGVKGGTLSVKTPNGTTFTLAIPMNDAPPAETARVT